ncbi:MAG TPA: hypothetical protein VG712_01870, partial [Gemmatimonadales bacterium]|nr:hypothetical protein [Gemmatimonadales bacterium]
MPRLLDRGALLGLSFGLLLPLPACQPDIDLQPPPDTAGDALRDRLPPPAGLVSLAVDGRTLSLWPYTGTDFSGSPQDPVNLVFTGRADPRAARSALLALDGNRAAFGFPGVPPFDCTWSDAIGDLQTGWSDQNGWVGSAVQLACGGFGPVRFHLRVFQAGRATLGNAHFEVLIPGTTDHQVLSWELAEQLVAADLVRTGLLTAPPAPTVGINAAPEFRAVPAVIYNLLPGELRQLVGGPAGPVTADVGIATDGRATQVVLAGGAPKARGTSQQFTIQFDQVIPRPFCASGPADYILVRGPVDFRKDVRVTGSGALMSVYHARGSLEVTPVNPLTGQAAGPTYR